MCDVILFEQSDPFSWMPNESNVLFHQQQQQKGPTSENLKYMYSLRILNMLIYIYNLKKYSPTTTLHNLCTTQDI
jgi:hypothetical protein